MVEREEAQGPREAIGGREVDGVDGTEAEGGAEFGRSCDAPLVDRHEHEGVEVGPRRGPQFVCQHFGTGHAVEGQHDLGAGHVAGTPDGLVGQRRVDEGSVGTGDVAGDEGRRVDGERHPGSPRSSAITDEIRTSTGTPNGSGASGWSGRPGSRTRPAAARSSIVGVPLGSSGPSWATGSPSTVTMMRSPPPARRTTAATWLRSSHADSVHQRSVALVYTSRIGRCPESG